MTADRHPVVATVTDPGVQSFVTYAEAIPTAPITAVAATGTTMRLSEYA